MVIFVGAPPQTQSTLPVKGLRVIVATWVQRQQAALTTLSTFPHELGNGTKVNAVFQPDGLRFFEAEWKASQRGGLEGIPLKVLPIHRVLASLPKDFVADLDRLQRFEQETKSRTCSHHAGNQTLWAANCAARILMHSLRLAPSKSSFTRLVAVIAAALCILEAKAQPHGLDSRQPVAPFLNGRLPSSQPEAGKWAVTPAFPNLTFQNPVGLLPVPRSNRLCVNLREGKLMVFENKPEVTQTETLLDISARTQGWDDSGLMGMAFHPEFNVPTSTNRGYIYVSYQYSPAPTLGPNRPPEKTAAYNRLSRFTVPDDTMAADPESESILIDMYDRSVWHNGGSMFFHPVDGFLYMTLGDEGGVNGEYGNAQRIDHRLFSGVLRIDVNQDPARGHPIRRQPRQLPQGASRTANYFIPNDNPFQDPNGGVLEEFWCIGLRSPHRMTIDSITGNVWVGDVGQGSREEINRIIRGGNYQWAYQEGTLNGFFRKPESVIGVEMPPAYEYSHSRDDALGAGNNCVIGGYVYRGREFATELGGQYIFGDNGSGRIWAMATGTNGAVTVTQIATMPPASSYSGLSSFGIDHDNELYMCQMGSSGKIHKLTRLTAAAPPPPPSRLSETGAFDDLATLRASTALIPFTVNSPLWSDGSEKIRWMAVPNDGPPYATTERISFRPQGEWTFPAGSVFVKHFELAVNEQNPALKKKLETRFLVRDGNGGVYGITYKWRPDHSDADLLSGALSEDLSITLGKPVEPFATIVNIGNVPDGSGVQFDPNKEIYRVSTHGTQIGGVSDDFQFASQWIEGDFDLKARLDSVPSAGAPAIAGLMARESTAAGSRYVLIGIVADGAPDAAAHFSWSIRSETGAFARTIATSEITPLASPRQSWLRFRRTGHAFTAYVGEDGVAWTRLHTETIELPSSLSVGMAAASAPASSAADRVAVFSDFAHNRAQTWYYPSPRDCITCHTPAAGHVLGVRTGQLNGVARYSATGRRDNQLRTLNHLEMFDPPVGDAEIAAFQHLVPVTDASMPLDRRVRSYLAANCSHCHRPGGVRANFDARYETPLRASEIIT